MKLNMNAQASAFLCFIQAMEFEQLEKAQYVPYFNGRERGFVVSIGWKPGIRWAFYEHRNSDELCCVAWNDPNHLMYFYTSDDIPQSVFPDKWSVTASFGWGEFGKATSWLLEDIERASKLAA